MIEHSKLSDEFFIPAETVFRTKPCGLKEGEDFLFSAEYEKNFPPVSLKEIHFGAVLPSGQLVNRFLLERVQFNTGTGKKFWLKAYLKMILSSFRMRKLKRLDNVLYITNSNSKNFFHWFLDVAQKLAFIEQKSSCIRKPISILIPNDHDHEYIDHCLKVFDLNIFRQSKGDLLLSNSLFMLPDLAPTGNYRKDLVIFLREKLRNSWLKKHSGCTCAGRLYITRENAEKRKIVNEKDLLPILERNGFDIVDFDELGFEEQLKYTLGCEMLVSLHGAALTHMLWINDSAQVLEIRAKDDSHNNCYFSLASDLGHEYHYALADKVDATQTTQQADFVVDPEDFEARLCSMLEGARPFK